MNNFWFLPIAAFLIVVVVFGYTMYEKYTVIIPNAENELLELQNMTCDQIKTKNSIGQFWSKSNGQYARDMISQCKEMEQQRKQVLREILATGNEKEILAAGFEELWFGKFTHEFLPLRPALGKVVIPAGSASYDGIVDLGNFLAIIDYNNTISFVNEDIVPHRIIMNDVFYDKYSSGGVILPGASFVVTFEEPDSFEFHSQPHIQGQVDVYPYDNKRPEISLQG